MRRGNKMDKEVCLICKFKSKITCPKCLMVRYCGPAHMELDRVAIHQNVCHFLQGIKALSRTSTIQVMKENAVKSVILTQEVKEIAAATTKIHLMEGNYELAICSAVLEFELTTKSKSPKYESEEIIPIFIRLSQANLGLKKFDKVGNYLTRAHWILCNKSNPSKLLQSQVSYYSAIYHHKHSTYDVEKALNAATLGLTLLAEESGLEDCPLLTFANRYFG